MFRHSKSTDKTHSGHQSCEEVIFFKFALMNPHHIPKTRHHTIFKYHIGKVVQIIIRVTIPGAIKQ